MNYHHMLKNIPEESRSHVLRAGSLTSRIVYFLWMFDTQNKRRLLS